MNEKFLATNLEISVLCNVTLWCGWDVQRLSDVTFSVYTRQHFMMSQNTVFLE